MGKIQESQSGDRQREVKDDKEKKPKVNDWLEVIDDIANHFKIDWDEVTNWSYHKFKVRHKFITQKRKKELNSMRRAKRGKKRL